LLDGIDGIAFCHFTEVDVVRHPLVQKIIVAYEARGAKRSETRAASGGLGGEAPQPERRDKRSGS
jgi:phosphate starvation-inducible PhoH-like protein